jgi:transposase
MFSNVNMEELKKNNLNYVLGAPIKKLSDGQKALIQDMAGYNECEYEGETLRYRVIERDNDTRVLVTYSEKRARKNAYDRQRAVERLLKKMNGKKQIKDKELIGNKGNKKYIKPAEGDKATLYVLDEAKIAEDARWDGLHGVITDLPVDTYSGVREALSHYHSLWRIEESFRISKTTLKIRPMYHWTDNRIKAHVLLCYLVFACMRYLERRIFIQQREKFSPNELREAMLDVESSILRNPGTGIMYRIPKRLTPLARKLYRCLGLKRDTKPRELLNVSKYYQRRMARERVPD